MNTSETTNQDTKTEILQPVKRREKTKGDLVAEAFVRELRVNGYNASKAYKKHHPDAKSAKGITASASKLLASPTVQALLQPLEAAATDAMTNMIHDPEHKDHFNATKLTLAYLHGTPVARSENVNVNLSLEDILSPSKPVNPS